MKNTKIKDYLTDLQDARIEYNSEEEQYEIVAYDESKVQTVLTPEYETFLTVNDAAIWLNEEIWKVKDCRGNMAALKAAFGE